MEGQGDKALPKEKAPKGNVTKFVAIIVVLILIIAALGVALVLQGQTQTKTYTGPTVVVTASNLRSEWGIMSLLMHQAPLLTDRSPARIPIRRRHERNWPTECSSKVL